MRILATIFEVLTVLCGLVSAFVIFDMLLTAGAGQLNNMVLAASSAFAAALIITPYCIAGAFHRASVRASIREREERF